jgi:hypothetical protein
MNGRRRIEGSVTMYRRIAELNIERFRKLLAGETDEATRQTLLTLLAEEEEKLAELKKAPTEKVMHY